MSGFPGMGGGAGASGAASQADLAALRSQLELEIATSIADAFSSIPQFTIANTDPSGAPIARGAIPAYTGQGWTAFNPGVWTVGADRDAWIAGQGGNSPMQLTSMVVPVGTNGTPGYLATVQLGGGSRDAANKYKTIALAPGSTALPAWGALTSVAGGFTIRGKPKADATTAGIVVRVTDLDGMIIDIALDPILIRAAGAGLSIDLPNTIVLTVGVDLLIDVVALYMSGGSGVIASATSEAPPLPNPTTATLPNHHVLIDKTGAATGHVGALYS